jgi:hypothetical protein
VGNRSHRKAGRRSGRPATPGQLSLFELKRQDAPALAKRIMAARRRFELYHQSKDLRYD